MTNPKQKASAIWHAWLEERRTSIIGVSSMLCFITGCSMLCSGQISMSDFVVFNGVANSFVLFFLSLFSADAKKASKELKEIKALHNEFFD